VSVDVAPQRTQALVAGVRGLGAYAVLALQSEAIARSARPGQFVDIGLEPESSHLLRRPFSIYRVLPEEDLVEMAFDVLGPGTRWIAARRSCTEIDVVGPLGTGFSPPDANDGAAVMVGGGYGASALFQLGFELRASGRRTVLIAGAANARRVFATETRECFDETIVTTEDGSAGARSRGRREGLRVRADADARGRRTGQRRHPVRGRDRGVHGVRRRRVLDVRRAGAHARRIEAPAVLHGGTGVRRRDGGVAMSADLRVNLAGVALRNPIVTASGCFGSGKEMSRFVDLAALGAVVCKTVTLEPRLGIEPPRGAETPSGMLNAIGLQNPGVHAFRDRDLTWLAERGVPAVASIGGHSVEEYVACARALDGAPGLVAMELNLSCPNLEERGLMFALSPERTREVTNAVKQATNIPVLPKLSPDVTDVVAVAEAAASGGADGLALINTTLGMAINTDTFRPKLSTATGGLSGPAIKPIAVRCIWLVHRALPHLPIIGMGGVRTGADALELILAGATCVAVGTANFFDPQATEHVLNELQALLDEKSIANLDQVRGQVKIEG
jgi:dihydroorotate dehydrogenase (NAD+) catalytic subunit